MMSAFQQFLATQGRAQHTPTLQEARRNPQQVSSTQDRLGRRY
jgi:hypothetical protein